MPDNSFNLNTDNTGKVAIPEEPLKSNTGNATPDSSAAQNPPTIPETSKTSTTELQITPTKTSETPTAEAHPSEQTPQPESPQENLEKEPQKNLSSVPETAVPAKKQFPLITVLAIAGTILILAGVTGLYFYLSTPPTSTTPDDTTAPNTTTDTTTPDTTTSPDTATSEDTASDTTTSEDTTTPDGPPSLIIPDTPPTDIPPDTNTDLEDTVNSLKEAADAAGEVTDTPSIDETTPDTETPKVHR